MTNNENRDCTLLLAGMCMLLAAQQARCRKRELQLWRVFWYAVFTLGAHTLWGALAAQQGWGLIALIYLWWGAVGVAQCTKQLN